MTTLALVTILHRIQRTLLSSEQALDIAEIQQQGEIMVDPKIAAIITQFDEATNKIAARIQKLIDAGGLSPESEAALVAEVAKLNSLGQDPEAPIVS